MKKKGFTLIELLAVIVILAVVAIIATPMILGVIEKAEKASYKASVLGLLDAGEFYKATNELNYDENGQIIFNCNNNKCLTEDGNELMFSGEVPTGGQIILKKDGTIEAYYLRNNNYCALGNRNNLDVHKDCSKLDITEPELEIGIEKVSSNEIVINLETIDVESGIKEIEYTINGETEKEEYEQESPIIKNKSFKNLKSGEEYTIIVKVTNGNNKETTKEVKGKTLSLGKVEIKYEKEPETGENGYLRKQIAKIDRSESETEEVYYYVLTTIEADSNKETGYTCGIENSPGECTKIEKITRLEGNKWYRFEERPEITYDEETEENATIKVAVGDTVNLTETATGTLNKIDISKPEKLNIISSTTTTNSINILLEMLDSKSGIGKITCKYGEEIENYTENATSVTETSCVIKNVDDEKTYYYQICIDDKLENGEVCKEGSTKTSQFTNPSINLSEKTPSSTQNGYYQKQVAKVTYTNTNIENPSHYVKTTRTAKSNITVTEECGEENTPSVCTSITGTTRLEGNKWYKVSGDVSVTYDEHATTTAEIRAMTYDGVNYSGATTSTIAKIDRNAPTVTLGTATTTTNSISVPVTMSDNEESGLGTPTCKYSTTSGSYTNNGTASTTGCTISGVANNQTYYYQVCVSDNVGNGTTCKEGSAKTKQFTNPSIALTNTPTAAQNGYLYTQVATVTYSNTNVASATYYVKTTRAGTSNINVSKSCGTSTNPGTCTTITATKSLAANTWYLVSGNLTVTYNAQATSTGTITAITSDGKNLSGTGSQTISKIDRTAPSCTVAKSNTNTTGGVTATFTCSDGHGGITTCTAQKTGLKANGSYTITDNVGNSGTCSVTVASKTQYRKRTCSAGKTCEGAGCQTYNSCQNATHCGYSCSSGYTLSGSNCTKSTTSTATATYNTCLTGSNTCQAGYYCPSGGTLAGNKCGQIISSTNDMDYCPVGTLYYNGSCYKYYESMNTCMEAYNYSGNCMNIVSSSNAVLKSYDGIMYIYNTAGNFYINRASTVTKPQSGHCGSYAGRQFPGASLFVYNGICYSYITAAVNNPCLTGSNTCKPGYQCSSGYTLSGTTCSKTTTSTVAATVKSCPNVTCTCAAYNANASTCGCQTWGSYTAWSDSSSNYCTNSNTCQGGTQTVYY